MPTIKHATSLLFFHFGFKDWRKERKNKGFFFLLSLKAEERIPLF